MDANDCDGAKVLPIAKISIKKTGTFRTTPETSGNKSLGLHPPSRLRNQKSAGAYAREKSNADTMSEVAGALLALVPLNVCPSATENVNIIESSAISHAPRDIDTSFIGKLSAS